MHESSRTRGVLGEIRAEQYLEQKGYAILARNYASPGSEIDLIAEDGRVIVFAEVKMRTGSHASGREAVTPAKQKRICRGAIHYLMRNGLMNRQVRFDVIEIQGERVTHIENAFAYQGPAF
ncbi:MAG: YraN family protein [Clostridiales bacterium]|nr:YraN family protein [Clostridiales bacterium]